MSESTGRLVGTVQNQTGVALPGVMVTVTGPTPGEHREVTEAEGRFDFRALLPGLYDVTAELEGFNPASQSNVRVQLSRTTTLTLTLEFGAP